jgi:hypothetical protein
MQAQDNDASYIGRFHRWLAALARDKATGLLAYCGPLLKVGMTLPGTCFSCSGLCDTRARGQLRGRTTLVAVQHKPPAAGPPKLPVAQLLPQTVFYPMQQPPHSMRN